MGETLTITSEPAEPEKSTASTSAPSAEAVHNTETLLASYSVPEYNGDKTFKHEQSSDVYEPRVAASVAEAYRESVASAPGWAERVQDNPERTARATLKDLVYGDPEHGLKTDDMTLAGRFGRQLRINGLIDEIKDPNERAAWQREAGRRYGDAIVAPVISQSPEMFERPTVVDAGKAIGRGAVRSVDGLTRGLEWFGATTNDAIDRTQEFGQKVRGVAETLAKKTRTRLAVGMTALYDLKYREPRNRSRKSFFSR